MKQYFVIELAMDTTERVLLERFWVGRLDYCLVSTAESGVRLLLTHGDEKGSIPFRARMAALKTNAVVVCCYPAQVKQCNPTLRILGDWDSKTRLRGSTDTIYIGRTDVVAGLQFD